MKIRDIHIKEFGPYKDWSFAPAKKGVQLFYGPNESGKTSLLEAIRAFLFGWKNKKYEHCDGFLTIERGEKEYHLGRHGKKLEFYPLGEATISQEPAELWWHGLDKKTYNRIFALTLEDMQGVDILSEVDVRTRFFGAEGGERLSETVRNLEKDTTELLVASATGKRKINTLLEQLRQNQIRLAELSVQEDEYKRLQQRLDGTVVTEKEIQERLRQRQEYQDSVNLLLQAWDTYKRAEEAKAKMQTLTDTTELDREAFMELDKEINQCHEYMRIWQGKEEGLVPENFVPDSLLGIYTQEIENLYQQLATWEKLKKECAQGRTYLQTVEEQLAFSRQMQTAWRLEEAVPPEVDWYAGEKLASELRSAREAYQQWKYREPVCPVELAENKELLHTGEEIERTRQGMESVQEAFLGKQQAADRKAELEINPPKMLWMTTISLIMAIGAVFFYVSGHVSGEPWGMVAFGAMLVAGAGTYAYGHAAQSKHADRLQELEKQVTENTKKLKSLDREYNLGIPETKEDLERMRKDFDDLCKSYYSQDVELARLHAYEQQKKQWQDEGATLEKAGSVAMDAWVAWLPVGANRTLTDSDFFGMKQEYDQYLEHYKQYQQYVKRQEEQEEQLNAIEDMAAQLWQKLELETLPTTLELRKLYNASKNHQQNKIRWEQKEEQRKNYREEYDQWNRKEKELLLQQSELLQKSGIATAGEYRQRLLGQDQYNQWDIIYKQSQVQLSLLAPRKEAYELMCRRLKNGDKAKWLEEQEHGGEEIQLLQQKLAALYEQRGEIAETMRNLSSDTELAKYLQEKERLEGDLAQALEDWTTKILISRFLEKAQDTYEKERQPHMLEVASSYIEKLTGGRYRLEVEAVDEGVFLRNTLGERVTADHWSSGVADQVYLALRLSLAKCFATRVDSLPIILDDVLLRFDEQRQKEALALLADIGQEEQIFLFTCQAQVARLAETVDGVHVHELAR